MPQAVQVLRQAMDWGSWAFGSESMPISLKKFLFRNVGDTFLLSRATYGSPVQPIPEAEVEQRLTMPLDTFISDPTMFLKTTLDHNHTSYSHDIFIAAKLQAKREQKRV